MIEHPQVLQPLTQATIDWLLGKGVQPEAIVQPSPIMTCKGVRAKDGRFDADPEAPNFFAFEEERDLVFWQPKTGDFATSEGHAFCLGEYLIYNPAVTAFDGWLHVFADPLTWLQNKRFGIVVIRWDMAFDMLRYTDRIAVDEEILATYRKHMKPPHMPKLAVLPKAERRAA